MAPMVRGSELAFRNLVRSTGIATPCFSPMVPAEKVVRAWKELTSTASDDDDLRQGITINDNTINKSHDEDGILLLEDIMIDSEPLVVQLCGADPDTLYQACQVLLQLNHDNHSSSHDCQIVGIDLNLGCPQHCARRGNFGAFLAEEQPGLAVQCVAAMRRAVDEYRHKHCSHPEKMELLQQPKQPRLSCKIRLRDTADETISFAKQLQQAGCEMLTVHCRRREEKHQGLPDYDTGGAIVTALDGLLPVVINGNMWTLDDARTILNTTKAHAVMAARGFLRNPLLLMSSSTDTSFTSDGAKTTTPLFMAASYLDYCEKHPPPSPLYIRTHFRWIFREELEPNHKYDRDYTDWKVRLWTFLVRPYLETIYQFRQVLALYARLKYSTEKDEISCTDTNTAASSFCTIDLPASLAHLPDVSFQDIRHNIESQALDEDDAVEEGGLALGLFD